MSIKEIQEEIIEEFAMFDDWMQKYDYLIELSKDIPLISEEYRLNENLIKGCQSKVWLHSTEIEGKVIYKESWGLKNLSYPIKNNKKAFYEYMNIEIPNDKVNEMNNKLNLDENIIRHLSIKVKEFDETPSPMIREKE